MTPVRENMPYRDCVGVAVFNRAGKVLIEFGGLDQLEGILQRLRH